MDVASDDIAAGVTDAFESGQYDGGGVVTLAGWVKAVGGETTRLYSNARFTVWIEIPNDQIVYQLKGCDRPQADGRSVLWVVADARVTACNESTAESFANVGPDAPDVMQFVLFRWPPPKP